VASTTFLFLRTTSLIAEQWRAASRACVRSCLSRCWFLPVTQVCPAAIPSRAPHHFRVLPRRCIVRIDEHGSKDRAKDASRSACDGVPCLHPVPTRKWRRTTSFPSSAMPSDIRCHRRVRYPRWKPLIPMTSRPRPPFQRHTAKRVAFQKTGMPLAATTREGMFTRRDCSLRPSRRLSRSRRPHFFPISGESAFVGHCKCHGAVTRDP